jgi:putative flippase GtrA
MRQSHAPAEYLDNFGQFSRFIVVGFSNFAVSFAVFFLFYNYWPLSDLFFTLFGAAGRQLESFLLNIGASSLDGALANTVGFSAGIINSFTWNKLWTFKAQQDTASQFKRFLVLNLTCLILSSASLFTFTDYLGWPYLPVWFVTMAIVTLINFAVSKYWVFRMSHEVKN